MNKFFHYYDITWPGSEEIAPIVYNWAKILFEEERHRTEINGVDFYTDLSLNKTNDPSSVIVTRWGPYDNKSSFYCISGYCLYDLLPWWRIMQNFFYRKLNLSPWLPFPCILISRANLRRHRDKGRPTALNYPLFGSNTCTNYFWNSSSDADDQWVESYQYSSNKMILLDTTVEHGSINNNFSSENDLRAICNMGFKENFTTCKTAIENAINNGLWKELIDTTK